jgi:hypothetical protein
LAFAARADDTPATSPSTETAASQIGRSIFIVNDVDGQTGDAPAKHIAVNDDILFEEDITTGDAAKAILEFRDGSTFEIGPDAAVRIDAFVFNPEESTSHKTLSVTRGVFRYVSAYVASDQDTKITTSHGQLGIRGSVAEGVVDPAVPDFVYLGEGSATFTNSAGSSALQPGNSIAVPSATTAPMAPDAMPAPVAAQALQAIETRLPPRAALTNRPAADEAWLKRAGAADLVPVADQQRLAASPAARPLPAARGPGGIAGELGLLTEANRLNLFNGQQRTRTAEQTAFLVRAARDNSTAGATLRRFTTEARTMHAANVTAGTAFVMRGVGHAAPSVEVMRRVTAASVRANPNAAAQITRHATDSYRGPDRGELNRPGTERPGTQRPGTERSTTERPGVQRPPTVHQPNEYERRQSPQERVQQPQQRGQPPQQQRGQPPQQQRGQPPQQQRGQPPQLQRGQLPQRGQPPQRPGLQKGAPAQKQPPKKGNERDQNQNQR